MADQDETAEVEGQLTSESIKVIDQSIGISNLNDEAVALLVDEGTYRVKQLTQVMIDCTFTLWSYSLTTTHEHSHEKNSLNVCF